MTREILKHLDSKIIGAMKKSCDQSADRCMLELGVSGTDAGEVIMGCLCVSFGNNDDTPGWVNVPYH